MLSINMIGAEHWVGRAGFKVSEVARFQKNLEAFKT
jgi:hypothetical protein